MTGKDDLIRTLKARRDKVLKLQSEVEDADPWFVDYRGKDGFVSSTTEVSDSSVTESSLEYAIDAYLNVELIDRSETPEEVTL